MNCGAKRGKVSLWESALTRDEVLEIDFFRRLASRNRIYQGYTAQYQYFKEQKIRPSAYQQHIDNLDKSHRIGDIYLLVANEVLGAESMA